MAPLRLLTSMLPRTPGPLTAIAVAVVCASATPVSAWSIRYEHLDPPFTLEYTSGMALTVEQPPPDFQLGACTLRGQASLALSVPPGVTPQPSGILVYGVEGQLNTDSLLERVKAGDTAPGALAAKRQVNRIDRGLADLTTISVVGESFSSDTSGLRRYWILAADTLYCLHVTTRAVAGAGPQTRDWMATFSSPGWPRSYSRLVYQDKSPPRTLGLGGTLVTSIRVGDVVVSNWRKGFDGDFLFAGGGIVVINHMAANAVLSLQRIAGFDGDMQVSDITNEPAHSLSLRTDESGYLPDVKPGIYDYTYGTSAPQRQTVSGRGMVVLGAEVWHFVDSGAFGAPLLGTPFRINRTFGIGLPHVPQ